MASNHRLADIRIADTFARGAYDPHTEAAEPTGWRANHIEETIRSIRGSTPSTTRTPRRFSAPSIA